MANSNKKLLENYMKIYGFLSKEHMKTNKKEYTSDLSKFYKIANHEHIFSITPENTLMLYSDEWNKPSTVYKTLIDAQNDVETIYLCDWTDDMNNLYYACVFNDEENHQEDDEDQVTIIVRTLPSRELMPIRTEIMDEGWHVVRLVNNDAGSCHYVWESFPYNISEFMELYCKFVVRYGTWEMPEDSYDSETEVESYDEYTSDVDSDVDYESESSSDANAK